MTDVNATIALLKRYGIDSELRVWFMFGAAFGVALAGKIASANVFLTVILALLFLVRGVIEYLNSDLNKLSLTEGIIVMVNSAVVVMGLYVALYSLFSLNFAPELWLLVLVSVLVGSFGLGVTTAKILRRLGFGKM